MGEQKKEDLYRNFSRKDLQGLCKKYGLPANKSNSEMATSLILYLEKKNLSSRAIWEGTRSEPFTFGTTDLQSGVRMNTTDNQRKDCGDTASPSGFGHSRCHNHQDGQQNDLHFCKGSATSDKASEDAGILTQLHKESNSGAGIPENTFSSVVSSPAVAPSPSFTFDVYSEDGIELYVDLDSNPSDWIESLKAGVHICHDFHEPKPQTFHQDIGLLCSSKQNNGSVIIDPSKEEDNNQLEDRSYPETNLTEIQAQIDEHEGAGSLSLPGLKSLSNAGHSLENSKEEQSNLLSRLQSDTKGQPPGAKSSRREETIAADSYVNTAVQSGTFCNNTGNSLPFDPKYSGMPASQCATAGDGIYRKPPLQEMHGSQDPVLKCSESSTTVCLEMQGSTCASMNQDIGCSLSGVVRCVESAEQLKNTKVVQCGLAKSIQTLSRDDLQMWPVQAVDKSKYVSCSPVLNSLSLDFADNRRIKDAEYGRASLFINSDQQIRDEQPRPVGSHPESRYLSPCRRYESQAINNLVHGIEREDGGFLWTHEVGRDPDEQQKKDEALNPYCNEGSLGLFVPKENGVGHHISAKLSEPQEDICRSSSTADVRNLGKGDTGNGREESEYLKFKERENSCKKPVDSEAIGEVKRKRHINSVEGQSKFVNTEAKNLRSSKQFDGDVHSKRRRSSRLFTK